MPTEGKNQDTRLIEAGFPCHQVGAETQRERGASSALPPLYYLHVWWARRPLTPSRAAILASLLPYDTDPDWFLQQLGIEKRVVEINGVEWTLDPSDNVLFKRVEGEPGNETLLIDDIIKKRIEKENRIRSQNLGIIDQIIATDSALETHPAIAKWRRLSTPIPEPFPEEGAYLSVEVKPANPAWFKALMAIARAADIRVPNMYGYDRAYMHDPLLEKKPKVILDPTAGGGSIPFEALRLGHEVIANELNPVASVILHATLDYPARFGPDLLDDIEQYGSKLVQETDLRMREYFPRIGRLPAEEKRKLQEHLAEYADLTEDYDQENVQTYLYCRQVICPHCGGKAPLLNSCWLSKSREQWGVSIEPDKHSKDATFRTYRVENGSGPRAEDPNFATVKRGVGICIHCKQAIDGDEIKRQARGESAEGRWQDRLFCVVAVRHQPRLDKDGRIQRYKSGDREGEIKTEKVTFFRPPNETDLAALEEAEQRLNERWDEWDAQGVIPTETIPGGQKTRELHNYGVQRWCDMFTPRQLLGHLTLVEEFSRIKEQMRTEMEEERFRAVATYLQFVIDKCVDYNSKQTRWIPQRTSVSGTFGRHDFSLKWTFGEIIYTGPSSAVSWGLSQIMDSYQGISKLAGKISSSPPITILNRTAAHLPEINSDSVDLVCMDPPYYDNVQYGELSDFYYVWQKRGLDDCYPEFFQRRASNKTEEAVANPVRDGSNKLAQKAYEERMREMFHECRRILRNDGIMTLMFTHKSTTAWETLTKSLIDSGWVISSCFPVESEFAHSQHQMNMASAASSIFITCRKRNEARDEPATWSGFGGTGVQRQVVDAVREALPDFEDLRLNPVDKMVASYGRALRVLSENWPVLDGDESVSPIRAMNEASRVVAERQIARLTQGRLKVEDLEPEGAMALTLYGIYGLNEMPYDDALSLSKSLNIRLDNHSGGYNVEGRIIGINPDGGSRRAKTSREAENVGHNAPLLSKGSKLRLARPEERHQRRIDNPQTEWDALCGLIMAHRKGDVPVARAYWQQQERFGSRLLDLLEVWTREMDEEELRKEGQELLFGLKSKARL